MSKVNKTFSIEADAIEGCSVPKTNFDHDRYLLFQIVASRNGTAIKSSTGTPIQNI